MKVYITGPYTKGDVACNVKRVIEVADKIANLGHIPFVPHLFHFWHLFHHHPKEFWMKMDLKWLSCCDVLFLLAGESEGAITECKFALENGIEIVTSIEALKFISRIGG
jgi:hypothetical protein